MEGAKSSSIFPPSAPIPPPIPIIKADSKVIGISENLESSKMKDVFEQCAKIAEEQFSGSDRMTNWMFCNTNVQPRLQGQAPRCGLVSLFMAAEMARLQECSSLKPPQLNHPENNQFEAEMTALLTIAKEKNFTCYGEMFSARNLGLLAREVYGLDIKISENGMDDTEGLINHLAHGWPVLVPYDASPNHSPCLANGKKSHWALITGFFCAFDGSNFEANKLNESPMTTKREILSERHKIFTIEGPIKGLQDVDIIHSTLHLITRQPKSRHVGVWPWTILSQSNANLVEYCLKERTSQEFVLPKGGLVEGLCKKLIYLKMNEN